MADRPGRPDAEQDRVAVAVVPELDDGERVPEVSPLCQSSPRERLQNHASPVSRVRRSASSSIQASISTRPSSASWTIAGVSSSPVIL